MVMLPGILLGLTCHEFAHAYSAVKLGDSTPEDQGRLTLNPKSHIDPMGFILLLFAGFGWAKPVQINPANFKNSRRDDFLVSAAGPGANLILAVIIILIWKYTAPYLPDYIKSEKILTIINEVSFYGIWINIILAVFNLFPIPPLDGSHILLSLIPDKYIGIKNKFRKTGPMILFGLIIVSRITDLNLLPIGYLAGKVYDILHAGLHSF